MSATVICRLISLGQAGLLHKQALSRCAILNRNFNVYIVLNLKFLSNICFLFVIVIGFECIVESWMFVIVISFEYIVES